MKKIFFTLLTFLFVTTISTNAQNNAIDERKKSLDFVAAIKKIYDKPNSVVCDIVKGAWIDNNSGAVVTFYTDKITVEEKEEILVLYLQRDKITKYYSYYCIIKVSTADSFKLRANIDYDVFDDSHVTLKIGTYNSEIDIRKTYRLVKIK